MHRSELILWNKIILIEGLSFEISVMLGFFGIYHGFFSQLEKLLGLRKSTICLTLTFVKLNKVGYNYIAGLIGGESHNKPSAYIFLLKLWLVIFVTKATYRIIYLKCRVRRIFKSLLESNKFFVLFLAISFIFSYNFANMYVYPLDENEYIYPQTHESNLFWVCQSEWKQDLA